MEDCVIYVENTSSKIFINILEDFVLRFNVEMFFRGGYGDHMDAN
jgi:hypothetical protein